MTILVEMGESSPLTEQFSRYLKDRMCILDRIANILFLPYSGRFVMVLGEGFEPSNH